MKVELPDEWEQITFVSRLILGLEFAVGSKPRNPCHPGRKEVPNKR
jgi:hypothetical protein